MAREVLDGRDDAGVVVALDRRADRLRGDLRVLGRRPRADGGVGRSDGDVGDRGEDPGEAEAAQLEPGRQGRLACHPSADARVGLDRQARGLEVREVGGDAAQVGDVAALLVDADHRREVAAVGGGSVGQRGGHREDLVAVGDVVGGDRDAGEVQVAHHRGRLGGVVAVEAPDDHAAGELLGCPAADELLRLLELADRRAPRGRRVRVLGRLRGGRRLRRSRGLGRARDGLADEVAGEASSAGADPRPAQPLTRRAPAAITARRGRIEDTAGTLPAAPRRGRNVRRAPRGRRRSPPRGRAARRGCRCCR